MIQNNSFGEWLRKQRRALDLSRQALADQAGCAEITLRRIEGGTLKPSKELASILLEKVGIPQNEREQWTRYARGQAEMPTQEKSPPETKLQTNIPALLTSFIGREKEQGTVINLLEKHRLVTLVGPGGVGKTRMALKIGGQILDDFANGVWLVELASLSDPGLLPQTVAKTFGLTTRSDVPILEILLNFLSGKTALLILDNCEHLLDTCAQLTDSLLKHCSNLKILSTSREPIGLTGEAIFRVPSLKLPDIQQLLDRFKNYESVQLFVERAQLVQTDFHLTLENASFVAQICSRLDGIPLALELAASKVNSLSVREIAEQLETNFKLLAGGSRTALPRQKTIQASIEWSWKLLSDDEQILISQLSIFAGGWTLESAQAVCDGDVVGLTDSLIKKSLIAANPISSSEMRYHVHEMVRQYSREKLIEANGEENIRMRHLAYFAELARQAEPELYRANQVKWIEKLHTEFNNIRTALDWAVKRDVKSGLQLMVNSREFWAVRSDRSEMNHWLMQFLEHHVEADTMRAYALGLYAHGAALVRDFNLANNFASQSLELARKLSNKQVEAFSLWNFGYIIGFQNDNSKAVSMFEQSWALYNELGNTLGQADALLMLGTFGTDRERNRTQILESLKLYREIGHLSGIATALYELVNLDIWAGVFPHAEEKLEEAYSIFHQLGDLSNQGSVLRFYGRLAFAQAEYQQACTYYAASIAASEMGGDYLISQWTRTDMAFAALHQGDTIQAQNLFETSIRNFQEINYTIGMIYTIEGFASLYCDQKPEHAARLIGCADATREKFNDTRPSSEKAEADKIITTCLARMDKDAFWIAYDEGKKMSLDEAVIVALGKG